MHPKGRGCPAAALSQVDIKIRFYRKIRFCDVNCESWNMYLSVSTVSKKVTLQLCLLMT